MKYPEWFRKEYKIELECKDPTRKGGMWISLSDVEKLMSEFEGVLNSNFIDEMNKSLKIQAKEIFDKFDEYSCIKDDKWYKELKQKYFT